MEFLIITGLSGAGKSRAADVLEDLDYYCVDNMPVALMPRFAELCLDAHGRYEKVALVTDVRERDGFGELLSTLDELQAMEGCTVRILYMDADLRTLVRRYKESRRPHPLAGRGVTLEQAVAREEALLAPIKARADVVLNSSQLTLGQRSPPCPSAISTASPWTRTWCSTCDFCPIPSMWRVCAPSRGWISRCRTLCSAIPRPGNLWICS